MPRSARAPSRLGAGDGTGDNAGITEPLLDADDVLTPGAHSRHEETPAGPARRAHAPEHDREARRARRPPSPAPEEWARFAASCASGRASCT